jgi:hypothetical protein
MVSETVKPLVVTKSERYEDKLKLSKRQARRYLGLLHEDSNARANFTFLIADDRKDLPKDPRRARPSQVYCDGDKLPPRTLCGSLDECWERLKEANRKGYGVLVAIQKLDDTGERRSENVCGIRTCVNDLDHGSPPKP